jgi:hypothetical protein
MCTVTYLPVDNQNFILTSNRDEQASRPIAFLPDFLYINNVKVLCPVDAKAKGTWIATTSYRTACLLNGAFTPHLPKEKYRQSRGQVVMDSFKYTDLERFLSEYDLADIEPFTLVMVNHNPLLLTELIWDGEQKVITKKNPSEPCIWSSVTLYPPEVVNQRKNWFDIFLNNQFQHQEKNLTKIIDFHRFGGEGNIENDILMNRQGRLLTVSITSVLKTKNEQKMYYFDLVNYQEKEIIY